MKNDYLSANLNLSPLTTNSDIYETSFAYISKKGDNTKLVS